MMYYQWVLGANLGHKLLYKGGKRGKEGGEERKGKRERKKKGGGGGGGGGGEGGGRGNGGKFEYCNKWEATILAKFWLSSLD